MLNKFVDLQKQVEDYLYFKQSVCNCAQNTITAYRQDIEGFLDFLKKEDLNFWPTKAVDVTAFLKEQSLNKSASSVNRLISSLRSFYQWLARQGIQRINPMLEIDFSKQEAKIPLVLSERELEILFHQPDINKKLGLRDRALLEILYATGIRVGELVNLKLDDLYADLQLIKVSSNSAKERLIPIGETSLSWLKRYLEKVRGFLITKAKQKSQFLFLNSCGQKLTRQAVWQSIKRYCKMAGINKTVTSYTLRHTFAVNLLKNGADLSVVQKILGYTINDNIPDIPQTRILQVYKAAHSRF